jgi:HEAT repeats
MMFPAAKLARYYQGPIALRLPYLALILILGAPCASRGQEAAASGVKPPVQPGSAEQTYRVIVWPTGPEGLATPPNRYDMDIVGREISYSGGKDGSYVIPNIPPGHYKLVSMALADVEIVGEGDTTFDVTNADVTLYLTVGGLSEVQGVARLDSAQSRVPPGVMIGLESSDAATQGEELDATGHFTIDRVPPGGYNFKVFNAPDGVVLRVVRCGGTTITPDSPLRVAHTQKITGCEVLLGREAPKPDAPKESASDLVAQFNSAKDGFQQFAVAEKIVALHDNSVLQDLEPWLSNADMHLRGNAAFIFARLGDDRGFEVIRGILEDRSTKRTVFEMGDNGRPSPESQIRQDRYYAAHLFGDLKDPRAVPILVPLLSDAEVNWVVPWSLGQIGDKSAIPPLVVALSDSSSDMRVLAIDGLVQLNAKEALPQIRALLGDNEKIHFDGLGTVADAAKEAVAKLEAPSQ